MFNQMRFPLLVAGVAILLALRTAPFVVKAPC